MGTSYKLRSVSVDPMHFVVEYFSDEGSRTLNIPFPFEWDESNNVVLLEGEKLERHIESFSPFPMIEKFKGVDISALSAMVEPTEPAAQAAAEPTVSIKNQLADIDYQSVRSLRAIAAGTATEEDRSVLNSLEEQAQSLRQQLAE